MATAINSEVYSNFTSSPCLRVQADVVCPSLVEEDLLPLARPKLLDEVADGDAQSGLAFLSSSD